jgi:hypothetical protein
LIDLSSEHPIWSCSLLRLSASGERSAVDAFASPSNRGELFVFRSEGREGVEFRIRKPPNHGEHLLILETKTRQDKTRQDKTRHDTTRQDTTSQDKARQDEKDKTRQDKTRQD